MPPSSASGSHVSPYRLSAGAVEGINGKVCVITKRACGFRAYQAVEVARITTLGLDEALTLHGMLSAGGSTHAVVDVFGTFE